LTPKEKINDPASYQQVNQRYSDSKAWEEGYQKISLEFNDLKNTRSKAALIRKKILEDLHKFIVEFESKAKSNGLKVLYAITDADALSACFNIISKNEIQDIHYNPDRLLKEIGFLDKVKSSTIPHNELKIDYQHESNKKSVFITGADFIISESGHIKLFDHDGIYNNYLQNNQNIEIYFVGIEQVLASESDFDFFSQIMSSFKYNKRNIPLIQSIESGHNSLPTNQDIKTDRYIIIIDNGRTDILNQPEQSTLLSCIHCGACSNVCPITKQIGTEPYGNSLIGPIGAASNMFSLGINTFQYLSEASTLCGACSDVCPVNIPIHKIILYNRQKIDENNTVNPVDNSLWFIWKKNMLNRDSFNDRGLMMKFQFNKFFLGNKLLEGNKLTKKSFNEQYKEKNSTPNPK